MQNIVQSRNVITDLSSMKVLALAALLLSSSPLAPLQMSRVGILLQGRSTQNLWTMQQREFLEASDVAGVSTNLSWNSSAPSWQVLRQRVLATQTGARLLSEAEQRVRGQGPPHINANTRVFDAVGECSLRVTLYRDAAGWCPYCQKVWLFLEEKRIPYKVSTVPLDAYGYKPTSFLRQVDSGKLPAITLDGVMHTESYAIMELLETIFTETKMMPSVGSAEAKKAALLLDLEKDLQSDWFSLVFYPVDGDALTLARERLFDTLQRVEDALAGTAGESPWFLGGTSPSIVDIMFIVTFERLVASALYWKNLRIRGSDLYPHLEKWFEAFERRPSYLATKADYYSLVMAMPSQNGPGYAIPEADAVAAAISGLDGAWDLSSHSHPDSQIEPLAALQTKGGRESARHEAAYQLISNSADVIRFAARGANEPGVQWHAELAAPDVEPNEAFVDSVDTALRYVVLALIDGVDSAATVGATEELRSRCAKIPLAADWLADHDSHGRTYYWNEISGDTTYAPPTRHLDACLRYLRDRVGVPRDMGASAAQALRAYLTWAIDLLRT